MDAADERHGNFCVAYGGDVVGFVRAHDDGQRLAGGGAVCEQYRPRLEAVAVDCIADADICQPVVAVCLGKHRHGLFPVSFGDDAGWADLV